MALRPALGLLILIVSVPLIFRWPFLGALLLVAVHVLRDAIMVETYGTFFYSFHGAEVLYVATVLAIVLAHPDRIKEFIPRNAVDWGVVGFMGALLVSFVFNARAGEWQYIQYNRYINLFWKALVLYFIVTRLTDSERRVVLLALVIIGGTSFLAWKAWRRSITGELNPARPYGRTLFHDFGLQMVLTLPLIGALATLRTKWYLRVIFLALVPFYVLVVMRTKSRSAYLGLGAALLVLAWYYRRRWFLMLLATPAIIFAIYHQTPQVWQRLESIWTHKTPTGAEDKSIDSRYRQMRAAMNVFREHPILGIGPRKFFQEYLKYAGPDAWRGKGRYTMHNVPLLILAEEGLVGFSVYYGLIVGGAVVVTLHTLRLARGQPELRRLAVIASGCLMGIIAWMAYSMGQPALTTSNIYAVLALAVSARKVARERFWELAAEQEEGRAGHDVQAASPTLPPGHTTEIVFS